MANGSSEILMRFRVILEPVDVAGLPIEGQPLLRGDVVEIPLQVTYGRPSGPTMRGGTMGHGAGSIPTGPAFGDPSPDRLARSTSDGVLGLDPQQER